MNVAYMTVVWRLRIPPVFAHGLRQLFQRGDFLPAIAAVFAAKQSHRFDAGVNDFIVARIDADRADIPFEHFHPTLAAIRGSIQPVVCHADEDSLRRLFTALNRIDNAILEMARDFLPAGISRLPSDQSMLSACV